MWDMQEREAFSDDTIYWLLPSISDNEAHPVA